MSNPLQTIDLAKSVAGLIAIAFAVFFFMDDRHAHFAELDNADTALRERILMSESTRYAEIQKYYIDKMKAGQSLTDAEQKRLDLVQKQQERIAEALQ